MIIPKKQINKILLMIKRTISINLLYDAHAHSTSCRGKSPQYLEWINVELVNIAEDFIAHNKILDSNFAKIIIKNTFKTERFALFIKRWVVEYYWIVFHILNDAAHTENNTYKAISLEDNPVNRFAVERYKVHFNVSPSIYWKKRPDAIIRLVNIIRVVAKILFISLKSGISLRQTRKKITIMQETMYGLIDARGNFLKDDFLVDNEKIERQDLLLFLKGDAVEGGRVKAYHDAQCSNYAHCNPSKLPLLVSTFFTRIIKDYIFKGIAALIRAIQSPYFSQFLGMYESFITSALPYEKIFSHYEVASELAYNYFNLNHIAESIICQNYGTKFYLMHWSDHSVNIDSYLFSFLGCDKLLLWGNAHMVGEEGRKDIFFPTGYVFKRFIKEVSGRRKETLTAMKITEIKKTIVSFFDESFGGEFKISEEHLVAFWETIQKLASLNKDITILIKPKITARYDYLSEKCKERFVRLKKSLEENNNVYIIDPDQWSSYLAYTSVSLRHLHLLFLPL